MRRAAVLGVGLVAVLALGTAHAADEKEKKAQTVTPSTPTNAPAAANDGKVIFTFADEAAMQEFGKVWQQRQATITRMAVLQAYWDQEQNGLAALDQQLLSKYHMDVKKNYTLDAEKKTLIEREAPPNASAQPPAQINQNGPPASPNASTPATP